ASNRSKAGSAASSGSSAAAPLVADRNSSEILHRLPALGRRGRPRRNRLRPISWRAHCAVPRVVRRWHSGMRSTDLPAIVDRALGRAEPTLSAPRPDLRKHFGRRLSGRPQESAPGPLQDTADAARPGHWLNLTRVVSGAVPVVAREAPLRFHLEWHAGAKPTR